MLAPVLLLSACTGTPRIEYKPLYLEAQPDKPTPPDLGEVEITYAEDYSLFVLTPEAFDVLNNNLKEMEKYIELLIAGWEYYEQSTTEASD